MSKQEKKPKQKGMSVEDIQKKLEPLEIKTYLGWLEYSQVDQITHTDKVRSEDHAKTVQLRLTYLRNLEKRISFVNEITQRSFWEIYGDLSLQEYHIKKSGTYRLNYIESYYQKSRNPKKIKEIKKLIKKENMKNLLEMARTNEDVEKKFNNYYEYLKQCEEKEDFEPIYREALEKINDICNREFHPFIEEHFAFEDILNIEHNFELSDSDITFLNEIYQKVGYKAICDQGYEDSLSAKGFDINHLVRNGVKWLEKSGIRKGNNSRYLKTLYEGYIFIGDSAGALHVHNRIKRIKK
jgi:hypothetical protein